MKEGIGMIAADSKAFDAWSSIVTSSGNEMTPPKNAFLDVKIRLRLDPSVLVDSLRDSIETIGQERSEAYKKYKDLLDKMHTEFAVPYVKPEGHVALPVPFVPTPNMSLVAGVEASRARYESLNAEYFAYVRYLEFIKSEDRLIELTEAQTVFYQSSEEVDEFFDLPDEDEGEDVFAAAEQKQRQLLTEAAAKTDMPIDNISAIIALGDQEEDA